MDEATRRRLAEALARQAAAEAEKAEADRALEQMLEYVVQQLRERPSAKVRRRLRDRAKARTIRTMDVDTTGQSAALKRGVGRATRKHPAQRKLYEAGVTLTEVAKELGEGRPRVSAWFAEGEANRAIPRAKAEQLLAKYGIPLSDWARIKD